MFGFVTTTTESNSNVAVSHDYLSPLAISHALRYSDTARCSRALWIAVVTTSVTDTTSAIVIASRSVADRYIWNLSGNADRNPINDKHTKLCAHVLIIDYPQVRSK